MQPAAAEEAEAEEAGATAGNLPALRVAALMDIFDGPNARENRPCWCSFTDVRGFSRYGRGAEPFRLAQNRLPP